MRKFSASRPALSTGNLPNAADLAAAGGGLLTLGSLAKPIKDVWPAVDATNGPITASGAITSGTPTTTNMTYYPWTSDLWNKQSQVWEAVPTALGPTSNQACVNNASSRGNYWNTANLSINCSVDSWINTDATTITLVWYATNLYWSNAQHDVTILAEHNGVMKMISATPKAWTSGGVPGYFYVTITMKEARMREWRFILGASAWFMGMWVNNTATVDKAPNKLLIAAMGDSWREGNGSAWSTNTGVYNGTYPTGMWQTTGEAFQLALAFNAAVIYAGQGGSGWYNDVSGGTGSQDQSTLANGCFLNQRCVDDLWTKFGAKKPIVWVQGGWNDGTLPPDPARTTYATRVLTALDKLIAKDSTVPIILTGIQPVSIVGGDKRDLSNLGIADAAAARPNNVIGFINQITRWSGATQKDANIGPDGLHQTIKGAESQSTFNMRAAARFKISQNRYNEMMAA